MRVRDEMNFFAVWRSAESLSETQFSLKRPAFEEHPAEGFTAKKFISSRKRPRETSLGGERLAAFHFPLLHQGRNGLDKMRNGLA